MSDLEDDGFFVPSTRSPGDGQGSGVFQFPDGPKRLEDESVEEYISRVHERSAHRLLELAPEALNAVEQIIRDVATPAAVRHKAAADLLDRIGLKQSIKVEVSGDVGVHPSEIISERLANLAAGSAAMAALTESNDTPDDAIDAEEVTDDSDGEDPTDP